MSITFRASPFRAGIVVAEGLLTIDAARFPRFITWGSRWKRNRPSPFVELLVHTSVWKERRYVESQNKARTAKIVLDRSGTSAIGNGHVLSGTKAPAAG